MNATFSDRSGGYSLGEPSQILERLQKVGVWGGSGAGLASNFKLIFRFRGQVKPDPGRPFVLYKEPRRRCGKVPESPDRRWDTEPPLR